MASPDAVEAPRTVEAAAADGWKCPAAVESARQAWALRLGDGGEEGHEAGAAAEPGDEDGGVARHLDAVDPLQRTGRICAGEGARRRREQATRG
jgi:hypothetical protein